MQEKITGNVVPPQLNSDLTPNILVSGVMKNTAVKITATQIPVHRSAVTNEKTILDVMENHKDSDWILTPECALSGYVRPPIFNQIQDMNTEQVIRSLRNIERRQHELGVGLLLGTGWVEGDGMPYNQVRVYDKIGYRGAYNKRLLTTTIKGGGEANAYQRGWEEFYFTLDDNKMKKASILICNDVWATPFVSPTGNPYYVWNIAKSQASVLFVSINSNLDEQDGWDPIVYAWHENHLQMFAKSFGLYIVASNSSTSMNHRPALKVQAPSGVIGPDGNWIKKCAEAGEDAVTVDIQLV